MYGFVRCASAVPKLRVADCKYNTGEIIKLISPGPEGCGAFVFPELCITGYMLRPFFPVVVADCRRGKPFGHCRGFQGQKYRGRCGASINIGNSLYNCSVAIYGGYEKAGLKRKRAQGRHSPLRTERAHRLQLYIRHRDMRGSVGGHSSKQPSGSGRGLPL